MNRLFPSSAKRNSPQNSPKRPHPPLQLIQRITFCAAALLNFAVVCVQVPAQSTNQTPASTTIQDVGSSFLAYVATNGTMHAGLAWSNHAGSGPLVGESLPTIRMKEGTATNGWVVTTGPAHADVFFRNETRDQIGWIVDVDHHSIPNVVLFRRLEGFAYAGTDSGPAFNGQFSLRRAAFGGGIAFAF